MNGYNEQQGKATWAGENAVEPHLTPDAEAVAILRHDMVNCLTGMRLQLELMGRKQAWDDHHFDTVKDYLGRMEDLVQDWRALSKAQKRQPEQQLFNLAHVVLKMVEANRPCATLKRQTLTVDLGRSQAMMVGDASLIQRALDNVISNAVKYTAEGGRVQVAMQVQYGKAIITVEDNGVGINEEDQSHVFEPYFRAGNAKASGIKGTGLGLAQVKAAVEQHGGTIHIRSVYAHGTWVEIHLPLQVEQRIAVC